MTAATYLRKGDCWFGRGRSGPRRPSFADVEASDAKDRSGRDQIRREPRRTGTVLIGGGYLGRAIRDENRTILDWRKLASNVATVWELFPIMRGAPIVRSWAGIEARMPDDLPVFGKSTKHDGVYHQFGFSAHGFQLGPGAGAVMAEIIATGRSNVPIDGLGIARFA